jgi:hypothetical protein
MKSATLKDTGLIVNPHFAEKSNFNAAIEIGRLYATDGASW